MEMQMVNIANFPSGSMARNTTAAQMQDAAMDSSGVPQPKTLMQMGNMAFVPMSVSRSMFLLFFFSGRLFPSSLLIHFFLCFYHFLPFQIKK